MIGYKNRPDNNRFIERRGCWMTGFGSQNLLSPNRALTRNSNSSQCCGLTVKHSRQVTLFGPRSPSHAQTLTSRMGTAGPRSTPAVGNALPTTVDPVQHAAAIIPEEQKRPRPSGSSRSQASKARPDSRNVNALCRQSMVCTEHTALAAVVESNSPLAWFQSVRNILQVNSLFDNLWFHFPFSFHGFRLLASIRLYLFQQLSFEFFILFYVF